MKRMTIAMLFVVLIVGCGSGEDATETPDSEEARQSDTTDKELEDQFKRLIREGSERPKEIWATESLDSFDQGQSFNKWVKDKKLSADALVEIRKWIDREFTDLPDEWDTSFVNGVGIKESLYCRASDAGVFVIIEFSYVGKSEEN